VWFPHSTGGPALAIPAVPVSRCPGEFAAVPAAVPCITRGESLARIGLRIRAGGDQGSRGATRNDRRGWGRYRGWPGQRRDRCRCGAGTRVFPCRNTACGCQHQEYRSPYQETPHGRVYTGGGKKTAEPMDQGESGGISGSMPAAPLYPGERAGETRAGARIPR
jgi:hypothetical protein